MGRLGFSAIGLAAICILSALPALADTRFSIRRMERNDVPPGKAQCDIRLQVDDQVEVVVDRDQVYIRTLSGQDARDDGSECNVPLPGREVAQFNFEIKDRRGDIQLVEGPSRRNGGKAIVRIRDSASGFGRYHFRLSWAMDGGAPRRDDPSRRPDAEYGRDFRIVNAFWGAPGGGREVTRLLQERMRDGRIRLQASNEEMGFDPAVGQVKELRVIYDVRGRRQEKRIPEGGFLELP